MEDAALQVRLREVVAERLPLPGAGHTAERHRRLYAVGREDLSLAKLAEAHWDAVAILAEAGREPAAGALYAVWASEVPGQALNLEPAGDGYTVSGIKPFCSGHGLVDRALLTAGEALVEIDLRDNAGRVVSDTSIWQVPAFAQTHTGSLRFHAAALAPNARVGEPGWYLSRPGFWHGACGPAACWAGGIAGLLDFALASKRADPHTLAHLGALHANSWAMLALLERAGDEIDRMPEDRSAATRDAAIRRALTLRHLIETLATDSLRRFARAYGPQPLSMNAAVSRRYQEADIFLRQSHAERDLEALGRLLTSQTAPPATPS